MKSAIIGAAGCLVQYQKLILVVRNRQSGKWSLPAGKPLAQETIEKT